MDTADILKIVVPIIVALVAAQVGLVAWIFQREQIIRSDQDRATKEYWTYANRQLEETVTDLNSRLSDIRGSQAEEVTRLHERIGQVAKELHDFKERVAEHYLKQEVWGENARSIDRKLDQLRQDFNREMKELMQQMSTLGVAK